MLAGATLTCAVAVEQPQPDPTQLERGKQHYNEQCTDCHLMTLRGSGHGPELAGPNFIAAWGHRPAAELIEYIRASMPPEAAGSLDATASAAITAYMLHKNGAPADGAPLTADAATRVGELALGDAWADPGDAAEPKPEPEDSGAENWDQAASIAALAEQAGGFVNRKVQHYTEVTDAMLQNPAPGDWLNWRGGLDAQGYSSLNEVNRRNVSELRLAWVLTMHEGSNQVTPLVHDGIMYLTHPGNVIQALDATSGDLIWEYANEFPPESKTLGGPTRNIAIYRDKLFMATYDAALVAVDARTGQELWKTVKADWSKGFTHTSGPVIADGVVVSGINGCERYKKEGCFITGHDPDSGKELWRTSTIALPGDPGDATWGGLPPELRAGGDTWIAGSYDPKAGLFYIGTSQPKPWVAASRGMTPEDAALYTNATLALDPSDGEIVWYYQHVPGETLDMEVGFERTLIDLDGRPQLITIGKDGILWKLDRETGEFIDFAETHYQNVFASLDRERGRVTYRQDILEAGIGDAIAACPSIYGGRNWQATAYSPETQALLIPQHQLCMEMVGREVQMVEGYGGYGGYSKVFEMPGSDGMLGKLVSFDLTAMKERWSHQQRAMFLTGVLTTAGGLAFIGDLDRYFKAFDVDTGEVLWQTRLGAALHGYPIAYRADGSQYIAVPTGLGVFKLLTAEQSPDIYQPSGGNALYVFALPD